QGMASLDYCLEDLVLAYTYSFAEKEFATHCYTAADSFQTMIDSIVKVKKKITPEVFTHSIRPFFEPFAVDGVAYSAPSGAEMSILNVDLIIWGLECKDELYEKYVRANILRLPIIYQELCQQFEGLPSMMSRMQERLLSDTPLNENEHNSVQALYHLLTKIYSFRMPHYKVAEDNVKLRLKETGGAEVKGSGGFGIDEVKYVLDQTIKSRQLLLQLLPGVNAHR
ncbi:MAG TPA: monodechloroaminopyrrolnitrin synthase PrnB family protein, partial [Ktedonobacteraceae bacterium]|nr:monodechloroaminopyrrolnitrin synthase PrnB family protein [Ktedonobacteraceae bacterium]